MPALDNYAWLPAERVKAALGRGMVEGTPQDLEDARRAAAAWVEDHRRDLVWLDALEGDVPPTVWMGAVLLTNHILSRHGSPQGLAEFGEFGPAAIVRSDPDVERLLGIGRYGRPVIG